MAEPGYTDPGLANGTTYYYVVTALDARFEGAFSPEAPATPSAGPDERPVVVRYEPGRS